MWIDNYTLSKIYLRFVIKFDIGFPQRWNLRFSNCNDALVHHISHSAKSFSWHVQCSECTGWSELKSYEVTDKAKSSFLSRTLLWYFYDKLVIIYWYILDIQVLSTSQLQKLGLNFLKWLANDFWSLQETHMEYWYRVIYHVKHIRTVTIALHNLNKLNLITIFWLINCVLLLINFD